jgi:uncharacterized membrane protein YdbT with pleckstrin-like domain
MFPGQHDGEKVELVFRQHPVVMRKELIIGLLAILLAVLPMNFLPQYFDALTKLALGVFGVVILFWIYRWIGWYYSVYVVTNERLVEIKQKGFFNRKVTEFGLDKVQNVNYHIKGFQAVIFQFGDITAQTYVGDLVMPYIYKPVKVHEKIVDVVRRAAAEMQTAEPPPRKAS